MSKISVPITKKIVTYKKSSLTVTFEPGTSVVVRHPITRRKLAHKLFKHNERRKLLKMIDHWQSKNMEVKVRKVDVLLDM